MYYLMIISQTFRSNNTKACYVFERTYKMMVRSIIGLKSFNFINRNCRLWRERIDIKILILKMDVYDYLSAAVLFI